MTNKVKAMFNDSLRTRPEMPTSYGIAADTAGMLPWSWVDEQITRSRNYWVITVRADGRPHAAPVWGVWLEDALYFGSDESSTKGRNFARDPRITVHLESGDDVVILDGRVEPSRDRELLKRVATLYVSKYQFDPSAENENGFMYRFTPHSILAWKENDFPKTAARWRVTP